MSHADDMRLPFPPDDEQLKLLRQAIKHDGFLLSLPGTQRCDVLDTMVLDGLMTKSYSQLSFGTYQFTITQSGREAISQ